MSKRIFISHSAEDKEFALALVELLEDMRLGEKDIFCSSVAGYGIPSGVDIFEYLSTQFRSRELFVFYLLSDNYYASASSLNEMGAS